MGKGSRCLVPIPNNSHALCFQGYGPASTAIRFSVETLVLLPSSLVFATRPARGYNRKTAVGGFHRGCARSVSSEPLRLWGCPREAVSLLLPQEADPCCTGRGKPFRGLVRLLAQHGSVTTSTTSNRQYNEQPSVTHMYSCLSCHVCTFPRIFIHFKNEEARKTNEVSPGRGVSGCSMYSMIIKDAETSSPLSRAPAGSTCCNNKLCSKNLGFHILCTKYKIINWFTNCLQPYLCF